MRRWLRCRPAVALAAAALGIAAAYLAAEWYARERPNYSRIEDGLFLGGSVPRPPPGATAVLNLCEAADPYQAEVQRWEPTADAEPAPSLDWLRRQVEFVASQRQAGRTVFVHCRNGVSRSGLVVAAYLMRREGWPRDEALGYLRSRRPEVRPNPAFMRLLREWEESLRRGKAGADPAGRASGVGFSGSTGLKAAPAAERGGAAKGGTLCYRSSSPGPSRS
jgi:protein-tyrosine phosphatase